MAQDFAPANVPPRTPTVQTGIRGVANNATDRVVINIDEDIAYYEPNAAPVTTVLVKVQGKMSKVTQRKFEWIEQDPRNPIATCNTSFLVAAVTVVLDAGQGSRFSKYDVIRCVETGENMWISAIATDTLTVTRGIGNSGTGAVPAAFPCTFVRVGSAYEEGSDLGTLKSVQETIPFNYTQEIRTPYGFSYRQMSSDLYGASDPAVQAKVQAIEHRKEIDRTIMWGRRDINSAGPQNGLEVTYTGGFDYFIQTNLWDLGGQVPTELQVVSALEYIMQFGKNGNRQGDGRKLAICSPTWITLFHKFGLDKIHYEDLGEMDGGSKIGLSVGVYHTSHGDLLLVRHPLLTGVHRGLCYILDPGEIELCYHQGGNGAPDGRPKLLEGRGGNGVTAETKEYRSDVGLKFKLEAAHARFDNLGPIV